MTDVDLKDIFHSRNITVTLNVMHESFLEACSSKLLLSCFSEMFLRFLQVFHFHFEYYCNFLKAISLWKPKYHHVNNNVLLCNKSVCMCLTDDVYLLLEPRMSFGPGDMGSTQYWHRQSFPLKVTLSPAGNGRLEAGWHQQLVNKTWAAVNVRVY